MRDEDGLEAYILTYLNNTEDKPKSNHSITDILAEAKHLFPSEGKLL
jgi:hypothetical protein